MVAKRPKKTNFNTQEDEGEFEMDSEFETKSQKSGDAPKLGDALKKVFTMGSAAAFVTEETIKSYLGDLKLPKEVLNLVIQGANKSKDEMTARVTKEVIGILSKVDWLKEAQKFAETHKFKITAEIDIQRKDQKSDKSEVSIKTTKK